MEKQQLIAMLNRDLTDEHAAIIRYVVHGYLEGEDTPLGAGLLSRAREEMWHFHWLGMIIGELGGEPDLKPAPYPFDPTNRTTIFQSYAEYELKLIPHYNGEAEKVDNRHIKRVLQREAWESAMHAKKFQKIVRKMKPEVASGQPGAENELPSAFVDKIQVIVKAKYNEMLQQIRNSWVFQSEDIKGWQLMDNAMMKMKQLAHISEPVAENGIVPNFKLGALDTSAAIGTALQKALEDVKASQERHKALLADSETQNHAGMLVNLDLSIQQEQYEADEIEDWLAGR